MPNRLAPNNPMECFLLLCHLHPLHFYLPLYYVVITLERHCLYTIHFTLLKCTIQWFSVFSQSCTAITTTNFRTFSSPYRETPYPLAGIPCSLSPPFPQVRAATHLLCVCRDLWGSAMVVFSLWCRRMLFCPAVHGWVSVYQRFRKHHSAVSTFRSNTCFTTKPCLSAFLCFLLLRPARQQNLNVTSLPDSLQLHTVHVFILAPQMATAASCWALMCQAPL